jgi:hypothetical protein
MVTGGERHVAQALMGPEFVVVEAVGLDDMVQLPQAEAEEVVQTLGLEVGDPRLGVRICLRHQLHPVGAMGMESFASSIPSIPGTASGFPS